jgi:hypothetical protein
MITCLWQQWLGILSPLVTQSVIDKVLVHQSLTTLDLFFIIVFEMVLAVARNYIFTHCQIFRWRAAGPEEMGRAARGKHAGGIPHIHPLRQRREW